MSLRHSPFACFGFAATSCLLPAAVDGQIPNRTGEYMSSKGFTLIELLIVIAVIAILAAILFPVFMKARDKAKQTTCLTNVKQISQALTTYSTDHDGYFPLAFDYYYQVPNYGEASWLKPLVSYVGSQQIFICPMSGGNNPDWSVSQDTLTSYGTYPSASVLGFSSLNFTAFSGTALMEGLMGGGGTQVYGYYQYTSRGHNISEVATALRPDPHPGRLLLRLRLL